MNCYVKICNNLLTYRFTWPGKDEMVCCDSHAKTVRTVSDAMGFSLELIPLADVPEGADLESLIAHGLAANAQFEADTGEDGMLDEVVRVAASVIGSDVNNEGVESQIRFLAERFGVEGAGCVIDTARKGTT